MKRNVFQEVLVQIQKEEQRLSLQPDSIREAKEMITFLQDSLNTVKEEVLSKGFKDDREEIDFFRNIKPQILGKLIYYNKVYKIETGCPVDKGKLYTKYFSEEFQHLKQEYDAHICHSDFYRYYRSGRTDRDSSYFKRGNINYHDGLNSFAFEIDPAFSTFFDSKVSRIISGELLYSYLLMKINSNENPDAILQNPESVKDVFWTDSKNALIELVYALYASGQSPTARSV